MSDLNSNFNSRVPKEPAARSQLSDMNSDLLSYLTGVSGMLSDTLVVFSTEFGRQPFTQGAVGRDHNQGTSVAWMAGAGVKGGVAHGESDPWSWRAAEGKAYCYDLHATILHLMGIDHTRLSVRHDGTDRRLTDVHGHVIEGVLA